MLYPQACDRANSFGWDILCEEMDGLVVESIETIGGQALLARLSDQARDELDDVLDPEIKGLWERRIMQGARGRVLDCPILAEHRDLLIPSRKEYELDWKSPAPDYLDHMYWVWTAPERDLHQWLLGVYAEQGE